MCNSCRVYSEFTETPHELKVNLFCCRESSSYDSHSFTIVLLLVTCVFYDQILLIQKVHDLIPNLQITHSVCTTHYTVDKYKIETRKLKKLLMLLLICTRSPAVTESLRDEGVPVEILSAVDDYLGYMPNERDHVSA